MKDTTETVGQRNSSETAQQNFLNFLEMKDIMCTCAYPQDILINFLGEQCPFLNFEIWRKWKILLKQFVSTTPLKPLNRIAWNFVVMKDIMFFYRKSWFDPFEEQFVSPFLSDCPSLMLGIAIHCILHSQAMLERRVCELAHSFFHFFRLHLAFDWKIF